MLWPGVVFYVPEPEAAPRSELVSSKDRSSERRVPTGRLILDLERGGAEVFADGYYVGIVEDFSAPRGGGTLSAGPHRIDVSASGFEALTRVVNLAPGQAVTVRGVLAALPPPVVIPRTTFYLIPGCYMGNIPPKDAHLPPTCDQSRATIWVP
jgi:PEGA domain